MSIINELLARAERTPSRVWITPQHVRAMRLYFNNAKRNLRAPITKDAEMLRKAGPFRLEGAFEANSVNWLHAMLMTKNLDPRDNAETRALGPRAVRIATAGDIRISWVALWLDGGSRDTTYEFRVFPGREKFSTYSVFRVENGDEEYFDYVYLPWQARAYGADKNPAGMQLVNPEEFYGNPN